MNAIRLTAIAASLALTACITPPKQGPIERPFDAAGLGLQSTPVVGVADEAWWHAYGDLQLDHLMEEALNRNPSLAQALARVREAQALADTARSGLAPTVSYGASETRERFTEQGAVPPPYAGSVRWQGSEGFDLSWDLDFWGRQTSLLKQARAQTTASTLDAESARQALSGAVMQAYVGLYRNYALADLARRAETQRTHILDITTQRVQAGIDTNVELRQAQGAVPQVRVELRQAQAAVDLSIHQLATLSGRGADAYAEIVRPQLDVDTVLRLPSALPANLLGRRADVLAARDRVAAATAGQAAAKAAFYPDINLTAFAGTSAIGLGNLFEAASGTYGAGPAIRLPIFDAGRLKAGYRGATAEIDAAIAGYNDSVLRAVQQTADQLTLIAALDDELREQQRALDAAASAYRLAEQRYQAGVASYLTVLTAESQVLASRRQHIELQAAQANARVSLLLAVGGSFDPSAPLPTQIADAR